MTTENAIRKIMEVRGKRFMDIAEEMGIATNTLAGRLKSKNISIEKLDEILCVLGYKIMLVPDSREPGAKEYEIG